MGHPQVTRRIYNALINSGNIRYNTLPDGAAAITLTAAVVAWDFGVWAQIVASVGAADGWLVGIAGQNPSDPMAYYDIDIGSGALAAEVSLAEVPYMLDVLFLPFPVRIPATTRVAGRIRSSTGVANTVAVKVMVITGA